MFLFACCVAIFDHIAFITRVDITTLLATCCTIRSSGSIDSHDVELVLSIVRPSYISGACLQSPASPGRVNVVYLACNYIIDRQE